MRRVEPSAQAHLHERNLDPLLGEPPEEHRGQELELGGGPVSAFDPLRGCQHLPDEPRERHRIDRPAVDLQPLAIGDEMRLGRRADSHPRGPQRAAGEGENAALAVRATDEGATQLALRITEGLQEGACPTQSQPDPEPASLRQRANGGVVVRAGLRVGLGVGPGQRALSSSS